MLTQLFPKAFKRYSSLPLLGAIADDFSTMLQQEGYKEDSIRSQLYAIVRVDKNLRQQRIKRLEEITGESLRVCLRANSQDDHRLAGTLRTLERFLYQKNLFPPLPKPPPDNTGTLLSQYANFLKDVRAFSDSTICSHTFTTSQFLDHMSYESAPSDLSALNSNDIEAFVKKVGPKYGRATLQQVIAKLRSFLRFLSMEGVITPGLAVQIDTPRVYRMEQLPRSLPWDVVCALLFSIDLKSPMGLRDYTLLFLIATYGLRTSEIVSLTLDDIHWREGWIQVPQSKTRSVLALPLTDEAGTVLLRYLRNGRPSLP